MTHSNPPHFQLYVEEVDRFRKHLSDMVMSIRWLIYNYQTSKGLSVPRGLFRDLREHIRKVQMDLHTALPGPAGSMSLRSLANEISSRREDEPVVVGGEEGSSYCQALLHFGLWLNAEVEIARTPELRANNPGRTWRDVGTTLDPGEVQDMSDEHIRTAVCMAIERLGYSEAIHQIDRALGRAQHEIDRVIDARRVHGSFVGRGMGPGQLGSTAGQPAGSPEATAGARPAVEVEFRSPKLAVVREGGTVVEVRGPEQVNVFRMVVEAGPRSVRWEDLVRIRLQKLGSEPDRGGRVDRRFGRRRSAGGEGGNPRLTLEPKSMQKTGNRIAKALGKLDYHWQQDGHGARWDPAVQ